MLLLLSGRKAFVSPRVNYHGGNTGSIDWFIEDQAFLRSYDSAPPLPLPPVVMELSLFLSLPVCRRSSLLMGEGGGGG